MRNGAKSSLTQAKIINLIISILFIIFLGYLIYFILISQKLDINIDITSDYNLNSINFKKKRNNTSRAQKRSRAKLATFF